MEFTKLFNYALSIQNIEVCDLEFFFLIKVVHKRLKKFACNKFEVFSGTLYYFTLLLLIKKRYI